MIKTALAKKWPDLAKIKDYINARNGLCSECKLDKSKIDCSRLCTFLADIDIHEEIEMEE